MELLVFFAEVKSLYYNCFLLIFLQVVHCLFLFILVEYNIYCFFIMFALFFLQFICFFLHFL